MKKNFLLTASFTLEASLIFSLILTIIFIYINLIFSLHDTVIAKALTYQSLISYAQNNSDTDYNFDNHFFHSFDKTLEKRLLLSKRPILKTSFSKNYLMYDCNTYNIPCVFSNYNHTEQLLIYKILKNSLHNET